MTEGAKEVVASGRGRLRLIGGVVIVASLGAYFTGWIPGSDPYRVRQVKSAVAEMLIDPASARFTNVVAVAQKAGGPAVCGEVNGKNRMGAYSGATRFHAGSDGFVQIDAGDSQEFGDVDSMQKSCDDLKDNPFGASMADQICATAQKEREKVLAAQAFADAHRVLCEGA